MPELPEVETVARQLDPRLRGQRLQRVRLLDPLLGRPAVRPLLGARVVEVGRLGKQVVLHLDPPAGPPHYLAVHLRMTGRLIVTPRQRRVAQRHLRARLWLDHDALLFYDPRRFGTLTVARSLRELQPAGLDPVTRPLRPCALAALLRGSRQPLKAWLLRQDRLVGLGNIYASEVLFRAGLHPCRPAGSLSAGEVTRLARSVTEVLQQAIAHNGTTFSDFQTSRGVSGSYQRFLAVFQRQRQPCPRCGAPLLRLVQQGRSTFFCGRCQR